MKLLFIHDCPLSLKKANIIQVLHMCHAFQSNGMDVVLAVPADDRTQDLNTRTIEQILDKPVAFETITYKRILIGKRFSMLGVYWGGRQLLKKIRADYCVVRNPIFIKAAIKAGYAVLFESHSAIIHNKYEWLNKYWINRVIRNSRSKQLIQFICISQALAEIWKSRGVPEDKIVALHDGVEREDFKQSKGREEARRKLMLPMKKKIVLYSGSLYPNRGIENIIRLSEKFRNNIFIVIGGTGDRVRYYKESVAKRSISNLLFLGHVSHHQVKDYLYAADILLMIWTSAVKTINYCSPLKMFEYMAAGRIIVGHGFPTIREVLKDGETAYLADPNSFDDLSSKLDTALGQSYPNPMAQRARELALNRYSWKARARAILSKLEKGS